MIDYSVYMMAPSLDEEGAPKAYARAQMRELVTFDKFVRHIVVTFDKFVRHIAEHTSATTGV